MVHISDVSTGGHGTMPQKFGLAPGCPPLFTHSAYNVPYTTGVDAPQVV